MGINSGRRFGTSGTVKFTHGKIWTAIDAPARRYGLTPSGLAKRAGLDVTAFNPSKPRDRGSRGRANSRARIAMKVLSVLFLGVAVLFIFL